MKIKKIEHPIKQKHRTNEENKIKTIVINV